MNQDIKNSFTILAASTSIFFIQLHVVCLTFEILFMTILHFCVCYLRMQMQTLCRAVEILITTSCSTSVNFFYRGLTEVFIASPFCD